MAPASILFHSFFYSFFCTLHRDDWYRTLMRMCTGALRWICILHCCNITSLSFSSLCLSFLLALYVYFVLFYFSAVVCFYIYINNAYTSSFMICFFMLHGFSIMFFNSPMRISFHMSLISRFIIAWLLCLLTSISKSYPPVLFLPSPCLFSLHEKSTLPGFAVCLFHKSKG